jgi:hypothetical protein
MNNSVAQQCAPPLAKSWIHKEGHGRTCHASTYESCGRFHNYPLSVF